MKENSVARLKPSRYVALVALALLLVAAPVLAQVRTTGQIVGTVKDPSGAVVLDADVEVTDIGTGAAAAAKTSKDGGFVFPALQPGHYRLLATAGGFQPAVLADVVVETGRATNVSVQ